MWCLTFLPALTHTHSLAIGAIAGTCKNLGQHPRSVSASCPSSPDIQSLRALRLAKTGAAVIWCRARQGSAATYIDERMLKCFLMSCDAL